MERVDSEIDMESNPSFEAPASARIWKDSSAAEAYGTYLDHPGGMGNGSELHGSNMRSTGVGQAHDIAVGQLDIDADSTAGARGSTRKAYSGRKVVWPGAVFLLTITLGAAAMIAYFGVQHYNAAQKQQEVSQEFTNLEPRQPLPLKVCRVPNYVTDGTKLYALGGSEKHEVHFTGINWSGMENKEGVPHGLATKQSNIDDIAARLNTMEINAVRLPLNAKMVIDNSAPDVKNFVSRVSADLFAVTTYIDMIKKVVQALARKQIAVLLDLHKLDPTYNKTTSEPLWYTDEFPEKAVIGMFQTLAAELCNEKHYNIIGVDLKNEPVDGCWPAKDTDPDCPAKRNWPRAAERLGNAILKACPNWLIVVEGLTANNIVGKINGHDVTYSDWFGASLQNATANPIKLTPANKLVYAPHFYSPSVYPSSYFFASQKVLDGGAVSVEEYPDTVEGNAQLQTALKTVLDAAFGDVLTNATAPVFYGEFGGIYGVKEKLASKTSTRVIDYLIQYADKKKMIGGFSWALNPDEVYDFNDVFKKGGFQFGLFADKTYSTFNDDYAAGLKKLKGNGIIPCFARIVTSSDSSAASSVDAGSASTTTTTTNATTAATAAAATTAATAAAATTAAAAATVAPAAARRVVSTFTFTT